MHCTECGKPVPDGSRFCLSCGTAVSIATSAVAGAGAVGHTAPMVTAPETKSCPFCGEQIMSAAIRCRFCNSDLNRGLSVPQQGGIAVQGPSAGVPPSIVIQNVQSSQPSQPHFVPHEVKNPGIAMLLSIVFPGGGQFYNGHAGKGILILCTFWLVIPWFWGVFDAYSCAKRINRVGF